MRHGRQRALTAIVLSFCAGIWLAVQTPAGATALTAQARQAATVSAASALPAEPAAGQGESRTTAEADTRHTVQTSSTGLIAGPAPKGASRQAAGQTGDYEPAGCNDPTPEQGEASCLAMVRTSNHRVLVDDEPPAGALSPSDIQSAYNLPATGQGQTVAIVDAYGYAAAEADLAVYRKHYGLPACTVENGCFRKVDQRGGTDYPADDVDWTQETALDLDAVSAACPACSILLVQADSSAVTDLGDAVETAASLGAKFVSNSYGAFDTDIDIPAELDAKFDRPGVVVTAASGDTGNRVLWPSSNPKVVAVGGTTLTSAPGSARGWSESVWTQGGSGCAVSAPKPLYQSALKTGCEKRATADIAADADPNTGLAEYNSLTGGWLQIGGTSLASPLVAAMYALAGTPAEGTDAATYPYVHASGEFFDITSGSNGTCGDLLCTAGPGWDGPTGLGTPNGVGGLGMGPQGTVSGEITSKSGGTPFAGVPVLLTDSAHHLGFRTVTDSAGRFRTSVSAGTYDVTASVFDYGNNTVHGLTVPAGGKATADLALTKTPLRTVTGKVTDTGYGWPLYAKITVDGKPGGPVYTDPATGVYTMALPENGTYTLHTVPVYPGYAAKDATVALGRSALRHDVAVTADKTLCTAPGYGYAAQADFSGWTTAAKYGWTVTERGTSTTGWQFGKLGAAANITGGRGSYATANPMAAGGPEDTDLISPPFDLTGVSSADLRFDVGVALTDGSAADASVTTDGGRTWQKVYEGVHDTSGPVTVPLTRAVGHRKVQVRFHFDGEGQSLFQLSNVSVGRCGALGGGLTVGRITDANTHKGVNGASVRDTSAPVTDAYATGTSTSYPENPKLHDGFYWLYSPKAGRNTLLASGPRYADTRTSVSLSRSVHTYNPVLKAGRLKVSAARLSLKAALGSKATQDVTLTNTGTAPLKVDLYEQSADPGHVPSTGLDNSWKALPDYPVRAVNTVVASYEGRTYSVGGVGNRLGGHAGPALIAHNYVHDPAVGSWTQIADMPALRKDATGAFLNGVLYVVGGLDYSAGPSPRTASTTYAYHPASDTWTRVADLPQAVSLAATAVLDGHLYVIGGQTSTGGTAASYRYDPAADSWTRIADYPMPVTSSGCGGVVAAVVCAGGAYQPQTAATPSARTYAYHPRTGVWTRGADMPYAVLLGSYGSANGRLQVAGGLNVPGPNQAPLTMTKAVQYDPVGDVWTDLPEAPSAVFGGGRATGCGLSQIGGSFGASPEGSVGSRALPGFDQCDGDDVNWLSRSRTTVTLAPGRTARVRVTADTRVLTAPGSYASTLSVLTDSPYANGPVPVTLKTTAPTSWVHVTGTVRDRATAAGVPGATVSLHPAGGNPATVSTDSRGGYEAWVRGPAMRISVVADGYARASRQVWARPQGVTEVDFTLEAAR
ncbi:carboxypeptidase regulatory-like domain-containing protein [Streptomyces sp. NPDC001822]|uniref:carboxypeptidase regulatory-like domain-containing protein n=1 Tax=Streptomyces sp. NPDC001822 TaxID=3364614 RepID=UPI0036C5FE3D